MKTYIKTIGLVIGVTTFSMVYGQLHATAKFAQSTTKQKSNTNCESQGNAAVTACLQGCGGSQSCNGMRGDAYQMGVNDCEIEN